MNCREERYKICLRCIEEEMFSDAYSATPWWHRGLANEAIEMIKKRIKENRIWRNPYSLIRNYTPDDKLCRRCDYELEHLVVSNGKINTYEH